MRGHGVWRVFEDFDLPDDQVLVPGMIDLPALPVSPSVAWAKLQSLADGAALASNRLW